MAVPFASVPSVLPERRTGRIPVQEKEEARAIGRFVHRVEDCQAGIGAELAVSIATLDEDWPLHDAAADLHVSVVEMLGWLLQSADLTREDVHLIGRAVVHHARLQQHHDTLEDASIGRVRYRNGAARDQNRALGALCEQTMTGAGRHRPKRRPTDARQMELDGEGGGGCL